MLNEIFDVSGHSNKRLATRCLARKNRNLTGNHKEQARRQFLLLMSEIACDRSAEDEIIALAREAAYHLGDDLLAEDLGQLILSHVQAQPLVGSDKSKSWNFPERIETIVR
jgi:hypothetical protein